VARTKLAEQARAPLPAEDVVSWSEGRTTPHQVRPTGGPAAETAKRGRVAANSEQEFMEAMQQYKKTSGRMFPTWCEVLEVLQTLGYRKLSDGSDAEPSLPALR
jgi:hypothetical protein